MTVEGGHDRDMSQQLSPWVCAALGCISGGEPGDILLMKTPNKVDEDPFRCQPDHAFPKSEHRQDLVRHEQGLPASLASAVSPVDTLFHRTPGSSPGYCPRGCVKLPGLPVSL